jgi:hypothetical protein
MFTKSKIKILFIIISILISLSLAGCLGLSTDETQIKQIAKNIEKAIEKKDIDLFMENISYNYSDDDGGTYDNHINNLPEDIISQMELAESLASSVYDNLRVVADVAISNLTVVEEQYASGKMEIEFSLKICLVDGFFCAPVPWVDAEEITEYAVDFIKEDDNWKIISLSEN